jgi:hypothetical protein
MFTPFHVAISLLACLALESPAQPQTPKPLPQREFVIGVTITEAQANPTQVSSWSIAMLAKEGNALTCFIGEEIPVTVSGGLIEIGQQGVALQVQATMVVKNRIHIGGLIELKEPLLNKWKQLTRKALGSQCFSGFVKVGEPITAKLDLRKKNGKLYTIVLKVKEIRKDTEIGS